MQPEAILCRHRRFFRAPGNSLPDLLPPQPDGVDRITTGPAIAKEQGATGRARDVVRPPHHAGAKVDCVASGKRLEFGVARSPWQRTSRRLCRRRRRVPGISHNRAAMELDVYGGIRPTFDKLALDFGYWFYSYPGGFVAMHNQMKEAQVRGPPGLGGRVQRG